MKSPLLILSLFCSLFCSTAPAATAAAQTNEAALDKILLSTASDRDKSDACAKLKLMATDKSVTALATLLTNQNLSHSARYVLEPMPGSKAGKALRKALGRTSGPLKVGIINSLGARRDSAVVGDLGKLLSSPDADVAAASAEALGRIGGSSALKKIQNSFSTSTGAVHQAEVDALLKCANRLLTDGKTGDALKIFQSVYNHEKSDFSRQAAFGGMIIASGGRGLPLAINAIASGDAASRSAALHAAVALKGAEATKAFADLAVAANVPLQLALIDCLVQRNDPAAMPVIVHLADSPNASVRLAAITALGSLGDDATVELLAQRAATAPAAERNAARQSLLELNRGPVTAQLLAILKTASPKIEPEVLRALGGRGDSSATPALLDLTHHGKDDERAAALQAVGQLADASTIPQLVQLVAEADSEDLRSQAADALGGVYERVSTTKDSDVEPLVKAVTTGSIETRLALLPVCSGLTQKTVREALRASAKDSEPRIRDAAIHAICDTHDPEMLPDLLEFTEGKAGDAARPLAIRGCVHLTSQLEDVKIPTDKKFEAYAKILKENLSADDKRLVLSGIATVSDPHALDLALGVLKDADVKPEAEQAVIEVCKLIRPGHTPRVRTELKKLIAESSSADNRKAAQDLIDLLK